MKINFLLIILIMTGTTSFGQMSKQIGKLYDGYKYKEVIALADKYSAYVSSGDEKVMDDLVGRSYYSLQIYDSAVYYENKALSLDNDATGTSSWAYTYRGMALYRQGKKDESIHDLNKAIELDKNHNAVEIAKEFLGCINSNSVSDDKDELYFFQGEYKDAIAEGRKQLQKQEYKRVMEIVGGAYYNIHNYDSCIYFDRKALAADNDTTLISGWAHTYLGMALYQKSEKEEAITELRKAIELNKTSGSVRTAENFLDNIINGRALAIDSLHQAIKDKLNGNSYRDAVSIALAAIATNPNDALGWDQLGIAYCWLHNYDSSLYCTQKALAIDKEQSVISCAAHYYIGINRFMKNDREAADREFTAAINDRTNNNLKKRVKRTRVLLGLDGTYARWKTVEKDNIIFHFQDKKSIDDVDALMDKYEKEYANARNALPAPLPKKIDIFVWEHDAFARAALQNDGDVAYTNADFCVIHTAQDNLRNSLIVHVLSFWQKME